MLRLTTRVLTASTLLVAAAVGAYAAPARITDGTSNTILLSESPPRDPASEPGQIADGTSNTILLPEVGAPDPEPTGAQAVLDGTGKLRVGGVTRRGLFPARLTFDAESATFSLVVVDDALLTGHLVAKGTRGDRFRLFLDAGSRDTFTDLLAKLAGELTGGISGAVLGESLKLELALDATGARLKMKTNVLTSSLGEIVFKANLAGGVEL